MVHRGLCYASWAFNNPEAIGFDVKNGDSSTTSGQFLHALELRGDR